MARYIKANPTQFQPFPLAFSFTALNIETIKCKYFLQKFLCSAIKENPQNESRFYNPQKRKGEKQNYNV